MEAMLAVLLSMVLGYALGSIPWAYFAAGRKGLSIHAVDTGIAGAANVYRHVGHVDGIVVFWADAGKGAAAIVFAHWLGADGNLALPALAAAVAGHAFPVVPRFPGGVGLATLCGGTIAIGGWAGLGGMVVGAVMLGVLRNTGNAGGFGFTAFVILGIALGLEWATIGGVLALAVAVLLGAKVRHRMRDTRSRTTVHP